MSAGVPSIRRPSSARTNPMMQIRTVRYEALRLLAHDLRSSPALPSRDIQRGLVDGLLLCEWITTRPRPQYYRHSSIASEQESNPSNTMGKNRRFAQMGIATTPISEEASVVVIWQALAKHLGSFADLRQASASFLETCGSSSCTVCPARPIHYTRAYPYRGLGCLRLPD